MEMKIIGKVVDAENNTLQLVALRNAEQYIVFTWIGGVQTTIDMRGFMAEQDMKDFVGRPIVECSDDEFNNTLFDLWGFGIKTYYVQGEENANDQSNSVPSQIVIDKPEQPDAGDSVPENTNGSSVENGGDDVGGNVDDREQSDTSSGGDEQHIEGPGHIDTEPTIVTGSSDRDDGNGEPEKAA